MSSNLTQEQMDLIDVYCRNGFMNGINTMFINEEEVKQIINDFYIHILLKNPPDDVIIFQSPMAMYNYICKVVGETKDINFVNPYLAGSFDSYLFAFYDYMIEVLKIDIDDDLVNKYRIWKNTIKLGFIYPFDDICLVSEKPVEFHFNDKLQCHNERGPAIKYSDGFSIWMLNGVRVTEEIVMTPWDVLDPKIILTEKNAEVRREIVRKIGIERVIKELGADIIDRDNITIGNNVYEYELLCIKINDNNQYYLKMINPSIGIYHIEGVHPSCRTVRGALEWRNGTKEIPTIIT